MSNRNTVHSQQSFFNKVVECTGDIENAFEMMVLNKSKSFTDTIEVGKVLKSSAVTDFDVVDFFTDRKPATKRIINTTMEYLFPGEFPYSF